jgi:hypothetical protein
VFVGCKVGVGGDGVFVNGDVDVGGAGGFVGCNVDVGEAGEFVCEGVGVGEEVAVLATVGVDVGDRSGDLVFVGSEATVVGRDELLIGGSSFPGWF